MTTCTGMQLCREQGGWTVSLSLSPSGMSRNEVERQLHRIEFHRMHHKEVEDMERVLGTGSTFDKRRLVSLSLSINKGYFYFLFR